MAGILHGNSRGFRIREKAISVYGGIHKAPLAPWELRIGTLRVYYDVEEDLEPVVYIRVVKVKERNRVCIGREVIEL